MSLGSERLVARIAHRDEILLTDALVEVDVGGALGPDRRLPGEAIAAGGLVIVTLKARVCRAAASAGGPSDRAGARSRRGSRRGPSQNQA